MKYSLIKALSSALLGALLLSSTAANAKLNADSDNITLEAQVTQNIQSMLGFNTKPVSKTDITKQINAAAIELQTNELVRNTDQKLPKFKFKVVITEE